MVNQVSTLEPAPIAAFMTLQVLGGHVGMVLILSTILFSRRIVRHPVFVNFCVTMMLYALSYTLLLYTGQIANRLPNFSLCLIQTAMIYGAPAMGGMSVFMFTLHLYLVLRQSVGKMPQSWPKMRLFLMISAPYLAYLLLFIVAIFTGYSRPDKVHRSRFYCTMNIGAVNMLASGLSAAAVLASVIVSILTVITVHHHWKTFRRGKNGISMSILIRSFIVLFISILALLTCLAFLADIQSSVPNFVLACLPFSAFILFGTQTDFMQIWFFCCIRAKGHHRTPSSDSSSSESVAPMVPPKDEIYTNEKDKTLA